MHILRVILFALATTVAGSPNSALAQANPNTVPTRAKLFVECYGGANESSETAAGLVCAGENNFASAVKAGPKNGFVSAFASSGGSTSGIDYRAVAGLTYAFVVWGGNIGDKVPLKIATVLTQETSGLYVGARAEAAIQIYSPHGAPMVNVICNIACSEPGGDANEYAKNV